MATPTSPAVLDGSLLTLRRLRAYRAAATRRFPALDHRLVDTWSLRDHDALALSLLLEVCPGPVVVLEVGTFIGVAAFHFAGHANVTRVIIVDPNLTVAEAVNARRHRMAVHVESGPLNELRVLDVTRTLLDEFDEQRGKIQLVQGVLAREYGAGANAVNPVSVPSPPEMNGTRLIAFVDALHTKAGVHATLGAIFDAHPRALVLLDDCRFTWGPFVQAGVAEFLEQAKDAYRFQLLADLNPSLGSCQLGMVYNEKQRDEAAELLARFAASFTRRLDPIALLAREDQLSSRIRSLLDELAEVRQEVAALGDRCSAAHRALEESQQQALALGDRSSAAHRALEASQQQALASQLALRESQQQALALQLALRESQQQALALQLALRESQQQALALQLALREVYRSRSWRVTKPVRALGGLVRRIAGGWGGRQA